jgi:transcriptional regulator with GAF, ATPase, and Fis domain
MTTKKILTPAPRKTAKNRTRSKGPRGKESFEERLRSAVRLIDAAQSLTAPLERSIENLLRVAGRAVGSDEASVLVRDGAEGGLRFLVAIGKVADKLKGMRIPPGKGVAGFVFASGQPMAVADVAQEETFYSEVDRATGYKTETLLTTPLRAGDETVGVLQFVNREGAAPYAPHTPEDMDKAAYFADAIGTLVEAHETSGLIETLFAREMENAGEEKKQSGKGKTTKRSATKNEDLYAWLIETRAAPEHQDLMRMAVALRNIAARGDAERQLCREVLESLARFIERRAAGASFYATTF